MQKVAVKTGSCQKVADQLAEIPSQENAKDKPQSDIQCTFC